MMKSVAVLCAMLGLASAQDESPTCLAASLGGDVRSRFVLRPTQCHVLITLPCATSEQETLVGVDDLLTLLANYGSTCAGGTCEYVPRRLTVHWDGAGGPAGDTGMLGWEIIARDTTVNGGGCELRNHYYVREQMAGLSSHFQEGQNGNADHTGCSGVAHSMLLTRSPPYWGPIAFSFDIYGGEGTCPDNSPPTAACGPGPSDNAIADQFIGVALRKVSDGTYLDHARAGCDPNCGQMVTRSISKQGDAGEQYTIDVIDNYNNEWIDRSSYTGSNTALYNAGWARERPHCNVYWRWKFLSITTASHTVHNLQVFTSTTSSFTRVSRDTWRSVRPRCLAARTRAKRRLPRTVAAWVPCT